MIYHSNGQHWSLPEIHFPPETYQKGRLEIDSLREKTLVSGFVFFKECLSQDRGAYCCSRLINCCNHRVLWYLLRGSEFSLVKALQINVSCKLHCNAEIMGSIQLWFRVSLTVLLWRNGEFSLFSSFNDELLLPIFFSFFFSSGVKELQPLFALCLQSGISVNQIVFHVKTNIEISYQHNL